MPDSSDVLILGAGVIGLACAHQLLKAGRGVTVLDRGRAGGGASHGNCGTITPSHAEPLAMPGMVAKAISWMLSKDAPFYVKPRLDFELLAWLLRFARRCNWADYRRATVARSAILDASRGLLTRLVRDENIECEFEELGTLHVFRDLRELEAMERHEHTLAEIGITTRRMDGDEVRLLEPAVREEIVAGLMHPGDAHLRPDRYIAGLARRVRELGGTIVEDCDVVGFVREGGRVAVARTRRGDFTGRDVLLALGAWSPLLARSLDVRLPVQPGKGYSITYTRPSLCPRTPLVLKERSVCVTAWSSGYRLGSTMEFSGYDETLNRVRLDALRRAAAEYLREPEGPATLEEWYGWRPMSDDDLPILGRAGNSENLWLATGHGMLGVSMSAATGLLMSELIAGRTPSFDPTPYSPLRFEA